jgi:hypothetical protein
MEIWRSSSLRAEQHLALEAELAGKIRRIAAIGMDAQKSRIATEKAPSGMMIGLKVFLEPAADACERGSSHNF